MTSRVNVAAAYVFYLLFIVSILVFVVNPALARESWQYALSAGALFGLVCYATYDLTNLATVKDWPVLITVIDLAGTPPYLPRRRWSAIWQSGCSASSKAAGARLPGE